MKKFLAVLLFLCLFCTVFTGCTFSVKGTFTPSGGNNNGYNTNNNGNADVMSQLDVILHNALDVADQYIDGQISATQANNTLSAYKSQITGNSVKTKIGSAYIQNLMTGISISVQTEGQDYSGGTLLKYRNQLARHLGVSER